MAKKLAIGTLALVVFAGCDTSAIDPSVVGGWVLSILALIGAGQVL